MERHAYQYTIIDYNSGIVWARNKEEAKRKIYKAYQWIFFYDIDKLNKIMLKEIPDDIDLLEFN